MRIRTLLLIISAAQLTLATYLPCSPSALQKEWFPPLNSSHGLLDWSNQVINWGACNDYLRATCCEKIHSDIVFRLVLAMDRAEFSEPCKRETERILCAISCNPDVGLGLINGVICSQACETWYDACKQEFFSPMTPGIQKTPLPCTDSAVVCSRLQDIYLSGPEFCDAMSVSWTNENENCLTGKENIKERRGQAINPSPQGKNSNTLLDSFYRDLRILQKFLEKHLQVYTKFLEKHSLMIKILGIITVLLVAPILYLKILRHNASAPEAENDDFQAKKHE